MFESTPLTAVQCFNDNEIPANVPDGAKMMIRVSILLIAMIFAGPLLAAEDEAVLETELVNPGFHEKPVWFKQSFLDLREDVDEAATEGKRVILYFYQDGCPYCAKLLNENFTLKEIVDKTVNGFQVIAINLWGDREVTGLDGEVTTEKALAVKLKVMYTPTLLFLNEAGETALRINGYYPPHKFATALDYVAGRQETNLSFRDFLAQRQPVAASGKLHQEAGFLPLPLDLSPAGRAGERPLLVLMEMKQCPPCDELHGSILSRPALQESLAKFDVALVDVWSAARLTTPVGESMTATDWAAKLKVNYLPSMIFFDPQGREVFRTEAYLRTFHTQSAMEYIASGSYLEQPNFQRYVQARADHLREQGVGIDIME
jgi:thioredoxin-related protein